MQPPMPLNKRRVYFFFFLGLFCFLIPFLILYASGYRLSKNWLIVETGGVYIYSSEPESHIFLDGKEQKVTSFFSKAFFVQDLKPGSYDIKVTKEGFVPWDKKVEVRPTLVAEGYAFLPPLKPVLVAIPEMIKKTDQKTAVSNPDYSGALALFAPETDQVSVTKKDSLNKDIPADAFVQGKLALWSEQKNIFAQWLGNDDSIPSYFCNADVCKDTFLVSMAHDPVTKIDFYPGRNDVIIFGTDKGIYSAEMDKRPTQSTYALFNYSDKRISDWRVKGKVLFIKQGDAIQKIEL